MTKLGVNVDHVATVREARKTQYPDPVTAAAIAELAGADGIIVHLREDRRHIQDRDLEILRKTVETKLNLEMAATQDMIKIALDIKPDMITLVPERREELTTEGGLEVGLNLEAFKKYVHLLQEAELVVSLFIDPDLDQVKAAHRVGADYIEIHTGRYSEARSRAQVEEEFTKILNAVKMAEKLGLGINAGHGLNYRNVTRIAAIREIEELNIGHSIIARAVLVGLEQAVREMKELIR
ncbi:MAG: pyridoxine 5'-phosphate synthase [Deltaproteobacteria bacterium]|nr:MAG: pyridoxine 5'-phosphate synthase [Deltaproteobacteria bacterium]